MYSYMKAIGYMFYEDGVVSWSTTGEGYSYQLINELTFRKSYINDDGIPVLEFDYYYEPVDNALEGKLLEVGDQIRTDVSSDKLISLAIDTKETNPKCSYPIRYYSNWYQYEMLGIEKEEGDGWDYGSDNYTIVGYDNESLNHNIVLGWKMIDREQWGSSAGYNLYIELEAVCGNSIVYILDGGENDASNPSTYETNEGVSSFAPARKSGMRFMGWFADDSYTEEISHIEVGTEGPVYLYAKFESEEPDPNSSDDNSSSSITPQTKDDLLSMVTIIAICLCGAVSILVVYKIKMR